MVEEASDEENECLEYLVTKTISGYSAIKHIVVIEQTIETEIM